MCEALLHNMLRKAMTGLGQIARVGVLAAMFLRMVAGIGGKESKPLPPELGVRSARGKAVDACAGLGDAAGE